MSIRFLQFQSHFNMQPICLLFALVLSVLSPIGAQDPPPECLRPMRPGTTCDTAEPSIRFHYNNDTGLCFAFKYNGCGGNKNNFDTAQTCRSLCNPTVVPWCPVKSTPLPNADGSFTCTQASDCEKPNAYCMPRLTGKGLCCRRPVADKVASDYAPNCATGRHVVLMDDEVLIGFNCSSNFCPSNANCRTGNYFSACCGKD